MRRPAGTRRCIKWHAPKSEEPEPRSAVLSNVLVMNRSSGDDWPDATDKTTSREARQLILTVVIAAVGLILVWFFLR